MESRSYILDSPSACSKSTIFEYDTRKDTENISSSSKQEVEYIKPMDKLSKLNEIDEKIQAYQLELNSILKSSQTVRNLLLQHFQNLFASEISKYGKINYEALRTRRYIDEIRNQVSSELDNFIRKYEENGIKGVVSLYQKLKPINIYNILHLLLDSFGINIENLYRSSICLKDASEAPDVYQCERCSYLEKTISELKGIQNQKGEEIKLERNARDLEVEKLRKQVRDKESEVNNLLYELQTVPDSKRTDSGCNLVDPKEDAYIAQIEDLREYLKLRDDQLAKLKHDITNLAEKKDQEIDGLKLQLTQLRNFIQETANDTLQVLMHEIVSLEIPQNSEKFQSIEDILHKFYTARKEILESLHNFSPLIKPDPIIPPVEIPISKAQISPPECIICNTSLDMGGLVLSKCGHSIHSSCLKYNIKNCPECLAEIVEYDYSQAIEKSYKIRSYISQLCRDTTHLKKCPGGCLTMISIENNSFLFECCICKKSYCLKCQQEAHPGDICKVVYSDSWDPNLCRTCSKEMDDDILTLRGCRHVSHVKCLRQNILELLQDGKDARCVCGNDIAGEDYTIIMGFD